jgi:hypothetical protein
MPRPRKRVLKLSCGVGSLQQEPWWDADRRARSVEREPHPVVRNMDYASAGVPPALLFDGHDLMEAGATTGHV